MPLKTFEKSFLNNNSIKHNLRDPNWFLFTTQVFFWCLFESFYIFRQSSIHRINWLLRYWDSSKSASQIESCFPSPPLIFLNFSLKHFLMIVLLEFIGTSIEGSMGTAWEDQEDLALQDSSRKLSFVI